MQSSLDQIKIIFFQGNDLDLRSRQGTTAKISKSHKKYVKLTYFKNTQKINCLTQPKICFFLGNVSAVKRNLQPN
jgi:hypothetical protein